MKDEVREFKRERILDEAIPLIAEQGFQGVSIDTIAKKLKVTKPFIYTYFKNKDALLEEIFVGAADNLLGGLDNVFAVSRPPEEQLRVFVELYVLENIRRSDITTIFLNEEKNLSEESRLKLRKQHHEFDRKLAQMIDDGRASGVFDVDDPMLASLAISGMVRWVHRWYNPNGRFTPEQIAKKIAKLALRIVGHVEKPRKSTTRKAKAAV